MTDLNADFHAFLNQRAAEQAGSKNPAQLEQERQQQQTADGAELFTNLFAQLDEQHTPQEPSTPDPAEHDFNSFFGIN
jgi:hypothetical protein